jgi:hypothetical protein
MWDVRDEKGWRRKRQKHSTVGEAVGISSHNPPHCASCAVSVAAGLILLIPLSFALVADFH